ARGTRRRRGRRARGRLAGAAGRGVGADRLRPGSPGKPRRRGVARALGAGRRRRRGRSRPRGREARPRLQPRPRCPSGDGSGGSAAAGRAGARAAVGGRLSDAVVLMAYGSPSRPEDVRPYLEDVRDGRPVSQEAVEELAERYRRIGGRSPLDDVTETQRAALEQELGLPVFVGMKHWRPRIAEAVEAALAGGATRIVGLVLAPHFSRMSIGEYRERLEAAVAGRAELELIESWHDHEPFVYVLADRVRGT